MFSKACLAGSLRSLSAAALSLNLLWLTVSLPYSVCPGPVGSSVAEKKSNPPNPAQSGDQQPWNDMTEEKAAEGSNSLNEEYLHEHHAGPEAGSMDGNGFLSDRDEAPCISFDGELLVPPPNML